MSTREEAKDFLEKIRMCRLDSIMGKLDEGQRGIGFALLYLHESKKEIVAGDMARDLQVSTARVAAMLKKLEALGYLTRRISREDGRKTVVEITKAGIDYTEEISEQILEVAETLVRKVGKADLDEFVRISQKMKNALTD